MTPIAKLLTIVLVGATMLSSAAAQALTPTREQVRKSWENRFQKLDKNRDGRISPDEFLQGEGCSAAWIAIMTA